MEGNPLQSWPWKQNCTTVVAVAMIVEVVNNWRSVFQINILKKKKIIIEAPSFAGEGRYYYNSWVTGVYMAYMFDRNSGGKTSQIEWLFESNLRSFDYFKCSTISALQRFGFPWTPAAKAACLQGLALRFSSRLSLDAHLQKSGTCIQILDTALFWLIFKPKNFKFLIQILYNSGGFSIFHIFSA